MSFRSPNLRHHYRGSVLVAGPSLEPVAADEFKEHVADTSMTDDEANAWIASARTYIEDMTNIAMNDQTWRMSLDAWPMGESEWFGGVQQRTIASLYDGSPRIVELARFPLLSVSSVNMYNESDEETVLVVADTFTIDKISRPARLTPKSGVVLPTDLRQINGVIIDYAAGYGDAAADVPAPLRLAVKMTAAYMYSHRGDGCTAENAYNASGAQGLTAAYGVRRI